MKRIIHINTHPYHQTRKDTSQDESRLPEPKAPGDIPGVKSDTQRDHNQQKAIILYSYRNQKHDKLTLTINLLFYLFLQIVFIIDLNFISNAVIVFSQLTTLNYLITLVYLAVSVIYNYRGPAKSSWLYFLKKWLHVLSFTGEGVVVIFYWAILAEDSISNYESTCRSPDWCLFYTMISHGVVLLPSWLELIFQATDVSPCDFWVPVAWGFIYLFFINIPVSLLYQTIYEAISWKDATSLVYAGCALILCLVAFFAGYGLSYLRSRKNRNN